MQEVLRRRLEGLMEQNRQLQSANEELGARLVRQVSCTSAYIGQKGGDSSFDTSRSFFSRCGRRYGEGAFSRALSSSRVGDLGRRQISSVTRLRYIHTDREREDG